jgi:hypothetical protein
VSAARRERAKAKRAHVAAGTYVPRVARESKGTTSCLRSSAPRLMVEGYAQRESSDPVVARAITRVLDDYCSADKLEDASIGYAT